MRWFSSAHGFFYRIGADARGDFLKFIAFSVCLPLFKLSHLFFKIAYTLNQRRLRLLGGEDFFLKVYDRPIAGGGVVNVLQSLREIKRSLDRAEACNRFTYHDASSKLRMGQPQNPERT